MRDYLESIHWNKQAPAPGLPEDVALRTGEKYKEAYRRLTGLDPDSSYSPHSARPPEPSR